MCHTWCLRYATLLATALWGHVFAWLTRNTMYIHTSHHGLYRKNQLFSLTKDNVYLSALACDHCTIIWSEGKLFYLFTRVPIVYVFALNYDPDRFEHTAWSCAANGAGERLRRFCGLPWPVKIAVVTANICVTAILAVVSLSFNTL